MASINQQRRTEIYTFLSKDLGMALFSYNETYDVYRKQIKDHIITIHIKVDNCHAGAEIKTFLNINGENIWWHKHVAHSGYTLESLMDFDNTEFVRIISRHSVEFKNDWRNFSDL